MHPPWKILCGTASGTSHLRVGEPCQDYAHCRSFTVGDTPILVAACADGAGSASHAEVGARLACLGFLRAASVHLEAGLRVPDVTEQHFLAWYREARARLSMEACV